MLELDEAAALAVIQPETWAQLWPDAKPLAELHYDEVDGGVEPRRIMSVDTEQLAMACQLGSLKIWSARRNGQLLGYILWTVCFDPECKGLLIAVMGPWFVLPGGPHGLGARIFDESLQGLRALGVLCCFPHHRNQGRGAHLSRFFAARGAKPIKTEYSLWLGAS